MNEAYKELTDSELNKCIAQALGYRVEYSYEIHEFNPEGDGDDPFDINSDPSLEGYILLEPGVEPYKLTENDRYQTEEEAWNAVRDWAKTDYYAYSLFKKQLTFTIVHNMSATPEARWAVCVGTPWEQARYAVAPTQARAICEAWLMWKETQSK